MKQYPEANVNSRYDLLLFALLEPLQATGMHKERIEAIYDECCRHFYEKVKPIAVEEVIIPNLKKLFEVELE